MIKIFGLYLLFVWWTFVTGLKKSNLFVVPRHISIINTNTLSGNVCEIKVFFTFHISDVTNRFTGSPYKNKMANFFYRFYSSKMGETYLLLFGSPSSVRTFRTFALVRQQVDFLANSVVFARRRIAGYVFAFAIFSSVSGLAYASGRDHKTNIRINHEDNRGLTAFKR